MNTKLLIIIGISVVIGVTVSFGAYFMSESANQREMKLSQSHLAWDPVPDSMCFVEDRMTSGQTGSAVTMDSCYPSRDFEKMGCTKQMLEHLYRYSNLLAEEFDGTVYLDGIGLPDDVSQEKFEECFDGAYQFRMSLHMKKLLTYHDIKYVPDTLVVTGGPAFSGDPGCGAVIGIDDVTHWFKIDSISNPQTMTVLSENPNPCEVNTTSCFCNAQMQLTALTHDLSFFTLQEEEKYANILLDYIKNNAGMKNIEPKFKIGKLNLNFTDSTAIGYCGERPGDNRSNFFSGAIVNGYVKDYGLDKELSPLCAITDDAKWWERK